MTARTEPRHPGESRASTRTITRKMVTTKWLAALPPAAFLNFYSNTFSGQILNNLLSCYFHPQDYWHTSQRGNGCTKVYPFFTFSIDIYSTKQIEIVRAGIDTQIRNGFCETVRKGLFCHGRLLRIEKENAHRVQLNAHVHNPSA
jgi:hypothetical protein